MWKALKMLGLMTIIIVVIVAAVATGWFLGMVIVPVIIGSIVILIAFMIAKEHVYGNSDDKR